MAMGHGEVSLDISGIELACARLPAELALSMRLALEDSADAVTNQARVVHGYTDRTDDLSASIRPDAVRGNFASGGGLSVDVAANMPYGAAIEFGSKPHLIKPKKAKALALKFHGFTLFAQTVHHPGTKPYHYLHNALDHELPAVVAFAQSGLADAFERSGF